MAAAALREPVRRFRTAPAILLPLLLLLAAGCTVRWVAEHDEALAREAAALLHRTTAFLENLAQAEGTSTAEYGAQKGFYAEAHAAAAVLEARAKSREKNELTIAQVGELRQFLRKMEAMHRTGPPGAVEIEAWRNQAESLLGAILKLEAAKVR